MNLVVGTYEEMVLGYHVDQEAGFTQHFTDHSHVGSVKAAALAPSSGILATGSSDEVIRLFNLARSKELGTLIQHNGSITALCFHETFLLSASEDGTVIVWKAGKWDALRTLRGHKEAVYSVAVHPSGKLALTVSKDRTMKTWNLMTGKCAYTTNLKQVADQVLWSGEGDKYVVLFRDHLDVYSVQSGKVESTVKPGTSLSSAAFLQGDILLVGGDGGLLYMYDLAEVKVPVQHHQMETGTSRVKCIQVATQGSAEGGRLVATASSDGTIILWTFFKHKDVWSFDRLQEVDCKFRPVSLAFSGARKAAVKAEKEGEKEEEEEEEEEEMDSDEGLLPIEASAESAESDVEEAKPKKRIPRKRPAPQAAEEPKPKKAAKNTDAPKTKPQKKQTKKLKSKQSITSLKSSPKTKKPTKKKKTQK